MTVAIVIPVERCSPGSSGILTLALVPLNVNAFPNLPAADHVAFAIEPLIRLTLRGGSKLYIQR